MKLLWKSAICKLSHVRVRTSSRTMVYYMCVCILYTFIYIYICIILYGKTVVTPFVGYAQLSSASFIHVSNYFELAAYASAKTLVIVVLYNLSWFSTSPAYVCHTTIDSFQPKRMNGKEEKGARERERE